jgi:hypothetical protein
MAGFSKDQFSNFDPTAMAGFSRDQVENLDPTAMAGFSGDQISNFDPTSMAGFSKDQFSNFDPTAMAGFSRDQVENLDPTAVAGFNSDHVMEMGSEAVEGFGAEQVRNLIPESKIAVGDKIETFDNVGIEVRQELVAEPQRRLGGVGSFKDLAKSLMTSGLPQEAEGWDVAQTTRPLFDQLQASDGSGAELPTGGSGAINFFSKLSLFASAATS